MRTRELLLNNVIVTGACQRDELWDIYEIVKEFVISNNLFPTGPVTYFYDGKEKYNLLVQIDRPIEIKDTEVMAFVEKIAFEKCLYERVCEADILDTIYFKLRQTAKSMGVNDKKEFINFVFDVYGESVVDIYYPIEEVK